MNINWHWREKNQGLLCWRREMIQLLFLVLFAEGVLWLLHRCNKPSMFLVKWGRWEEERGRGKMLFYYLLTCQVRIGRRKSHILRQLLIQFNLFRKYTSHLSSNKIRLTFSQKGLTVMDVSYFIFHHWEYENIKWIGFTNKFEPGTPFSQGISLSWY